MQLCVEGFFVPESARLSFAKDSLESKRDALAKLGETHESPVCQHSSVGHQVLG
jgi:hypothetical protein